ncbi:exonuclease V, chloroplastic [Euphorbia lathyris]|uniref:exonuclease V, chloroplastic n=1 Tax=Euphorbia lathyris TaxID=212925 RepID=UPI0033135CC6
MSDTSSNSLNHGAKDSSTNTSIVPDIPIEIISEEEMAFIEAAFAATRSCLSSSAIPSICSSSRSFLFQNNARSIQSITILSKRKFPAASAQSEIEDLGDLKLRCAQKKNMAPESSFYLRYRKRSGLYVTDITDTEWCQKQKEFVLLRKQRKVSTKAMKAGIDRHKRKEQEVVKREKVSVESMEDTWAIKFLNFITGANQLLFEGLTRELPVIGFVHGVWIMGIIDEIRMPEAEGETRNPILVDTKTRGSNTLPSEPQRRNGRLQVMLYKLLWDYLVAGKFHSKEFFDFFSLNPNNVLSKDIRTSTALAGFPAQTFDDIVRYFLNTCSMLLPASDQMILRYESQKDDSLLGEVEFAYEADWLKTQMEKNCVEFWVDGKEASFTPEDERWKCRSCQFSSDCPTNAKTSGTSSPVENTTNNIITKEETC